MKKAGLILILVILFAVSAGAATYESIDTLNKMNLARYFSDYLGYYYNSHGCLHFSPSDIYLLFKTVPKGIPMIINKYDEIDVSSNFKNSPFLYDLISKPEEIKSAAAYFKSNPTKLIVYPSLGRLYIIVNDVPYAQIKLLAGPPESFSYPNYIEKGEEIKWDPVLMTPTDPGAYTIWGSTDHYISPTYYNDTIVPFGGLMKNNGGQWMFHEKNKWYILPDFIRQDLLSSSEARIYEYYDTSLDDKGNIVSARWAGHDFGKYVLLWTKDNKTYYPEIGYADGGLAFEQIKLAGDLADLLTASGSNKLDPLVSGNADYSLYRDYFNFITSAGAAVSARLDPTECSYYRLFNSLPMTDDDRDRIDPRINDAFDRYKNKTIPWLPWEKEEKGKILGLYYYLRDNSLIFNKYAKWYKKLKDDWNLWGELRLKLASDFNEMGVFSTADRKSIVERWLNARLEFNNVAVPAIVEKVKKASFSAFYSDQEINLFSARQRKALADILHMTSTEAVTFEAVGALNDFNFGLMFNEMLGNLYKSHGCLHVSPWNSRRLYDLLPIGAKITIYDYEQKPPADILEKIPYLAELISFEEDLDALKKKFSDPRKVSITVYPFSGVWIIYLDGAPLAKLNVSVGPPSKMNVALLRDENGIPKFDKNLSYPTSPGTFYVFKKVENYVSTLYRETTIIPMDALLRKTDGKWYFQDDAGKWVKAPDLIAESITTPSAYNAYVFYDQKKNASEEVIEARWGSQPFGRYAIIISADQRTSSSDLIHTSGDLMLEQRQLVRDLIEVLSAPKDNLEDCIKSNMNFQVYKIFSDFVENPTKEGILDPAVSGPYNLFLDNRVTSKEISAINPDEIVVNNILKKGAKPTKEDLFILKRSGLIDKNGDLIMEKMLGLQFETYQSVLFVRKYAGCYRVLAKYWGSLAPIRSAFLMDIKKYYITDPAVLRDLLDDLLMKRVEIKKLTGQDVLKKNRALTFKEGSA
ncbi:MAG: L,D-transpeptidase [Candidatus Margulisiibacteriota bacterium]